MGDLYRMTWEEVMEGLELVDSPKHRVYGVPRGGMIAAGFLKRAQRVWRPEDATLFLDDIIDSGATRDRYAQRFPGVDFVALIDKTGAQSDLGWVVFPWEHDEQDGPTDSVRRILQFIGDDPRREGLCDTPDRMIRAWGELFAGYKQRPEDILARRFQECGEYDQMVVLRDIPFWSFCEHHFLPFNGTAHVGYVPNGAVIGISKIARLVHCFARRLQVQERMTKQIADAIDEHVKPLGVGVVIEAQHLCMTSRGVRSSGTKMLTSALHGAMLTGEARAEFLSLARR